MAVYPVIQYPDPVLLKPTEPVRSIGPKEELLVRDLIDTMHEAGGVGLSANQIGVSRRVFVACPDGERGAEMVFFNPAIIKRTGRVRELEGCLSVRGVYEPVVRYRKVVLEARNLKNEPVLMKAEGLLSRIFQHEIDHLDGRVFLQRLGWWRKRRALSAFKKSA